MVDPQRPSFASDFPRLPALDALVDAFARGDYARVRADAPKLERESDDEAVKRASALLVERTKADPLAVRLLVVTALLLAAMTGYWVLHGKPPPNTPPVKPPPLSVPR